MPIRGQGVRMTASEQTVANDPAQPRMLGHYELHEKIGQGGMAVVYRGIQPSLNRQVAIKVLPEQFARSPELLSRFEREGAIISKLNHSNIVQIIDRGKEGETLYIVMECVEGEGLDKMTRRGPLPIPQVIDFAIQICEALEYAHGQGVVHRDLKPSNILIEARTLRPKIADFGIASLETNTAEVATLTTGNTALGTMNYMAPEQRLDSHSVTHSADLFSLGVILYEMLTGRLPIGHFKLPTLLRPDVPIGLDAVVKKCLAHQPEDRYKNARAVRDDLARFVRHRAGVGEIKVLFSRKTFAERRRVLYLGSLAAILLGILLVVTLVHAPGHSPDQLTRQQSPAKQREGEDPRFAVALTRVQGLIRQGSEVAAVDTLSDLLKNQPQHRLAGEAQFLLATAYEHLQQPDRAVVEYNTLTRAYPESPRVPNALLALCRIELDRQPKGGFWRNQWDADFQSRMLRRLADIERDHPNGEHLSALRRMVVEVASAPRLKDWRTAADALQRIAASDAQAAPDALFRAASVYEEQLGDRTTAKALLVRLVQEYPKHALATKAKARIEDLK
jgi:tRNA A-37 threonylcarbamoyl transferase component Bud32/outer membrane protein assembly factor BamD (BamD/ComL family)